MYQRMFGIYLCTKTIKKKLFLLSLMKTVNWIMFRDLINYQTCLSAVYIVHWLIFCYAYFE